MSHFSVFSLPLRSTKTVARDNLANERTFLACLRTSLVFVSVGIALLQSSLFLEKESHVKLANVTVVVAAPHSRHSLDGKSIAVACIVMGIVVLLTGFARFHFAQYLLQQDKYPIARISPATTALMGIVVMAFYFALIARI